MALYFLENFLLFLSVTLTGCHCTLFASINFGKKWSVTDDNFGYVGRYKLQMVLMFITQYVNAICIISTEPTPYLSALEF